MQFSSSTSDTAPCNTDPCNAGIEIFSDTIYNIHNVINIQLLLKLTILNCVYIYTINLKLILIMSIEMIFTFLSNRIHPP